MPTAEPAQAPVRVPPAPGWEPAAACSFLDGVGLKTRGYKEGVGFPDGSHGCLSPYVDIGPADPLANSIAFYCAGGPDRVTSLKLVLDVHVPTYAKPAYGVLVDDAVKLVRGAGGGDLPPEVTATLKAGKGGAWTVGDLQVTAEREVWAEGRGHEVRFRVRPIVPGEGER